MRNEKTCQQKASMSRELAKLIYEWHSIHVPLIKTGSTHTQIIQDIFDSLYEVSYGREIDNPIHA